MSSLEPVQFTPSQLGHGRRSKPHRKFTPEDDALLEQAVLDFGRGDWEAIAACLPGRTPRQCRERWVYYVNPQLNTGAWSAEEDALLLQKQAEYGPKWVKIARFFPDRTDAMVKNRWHMLQRKQNKEMKRQARGGPDTAGTAPHPGTPGGSTTETAETDMVFTTVLDWPCEEFGSDW